MIIYLDILLAVNLFIDFLLLAATARLLRIPYRRIRLAAGAAIGAASCVLVLLSLPWWLATAAKLAAAFLMIRAAFRWEGARVYIKRGVVFFVVSAVFAGIAAAVWAFAAPPGLYMIGGVVYYDVSPLLLIALTALSYSAISLFERFTRKREPEGRAYRLRIRHGTAEVLVRVLYDSGNSLTEPFSGAPVALVTLAAVRDILPTAWHSTILRPSDRLEPGWRLVPYQTIGGNGLLAAFCPDGVTLVDLAGERDITGCYVAVCETLGRGEYQGLIGLDLAAGEGRR